MDTQESVIEMRRARGTRAAGFHQADLCRLTPLALPVGLFCDCGTGKFPYQAARL
jgi:hypothetical protein